MPRPRLNRICSVANCNRPHSGRGYCSMHLRRLKRHGTLEKATNLCSVEGCEKPAGTKGFCQNHYKAHWANSQTEVCAADGCGKRARGGRDYCSAHQARLDRHGSLADPRKPRRTCSVEGCDKPNFGHGYCSTHYARWMHNGDAEKLQKRIHKGLTFIREVALKWDSDECLLWPFAKANYGYGEIWIDGKKHRAHRVVCEMAHGTAPEGKNDAAHNCGNRLCCNKRHVEWKTRQGNVDDMIVHGTRMHGERHPLARLTEADVREIRALKGKLRHKEIAAKFGISASYVSDICAGNTKSWSWLKD